VVWDGGARDSRSAGELAAARGIVATGEREIGTMLDVGPTKAVITQDPEEEMEALTSMYLVSTARGERTQQRTGGWRSFTA